MLDSHTTNGSFLSFHSVGLIHRPRLYLLATSIKHFLLFLLPFFNLDLELLYCSIQIVILQGEIEDRLAHLLAEQHAFLCIM